MPVGDLTPPDRHFSVFLKDITSNIDWTDFDDVLESFERRIQTWYLDPANVLLNQMPGKEFIITNIGCIIIDALSQFRDGAEAHDPTVFKQFTEDYFPDFERDLPRTIPSDLVVGSTHDVDTVSEAFYSGFRCGLAHSGTVLAFGGHTDETDGNLYEIWFEEDNPMGYCYDKGTGDKYPFIVINPERLIEEIREAFEDYIWNLDEAEDDSELRLNFARKIEYDFGEYGTRLLEALKA